MCTTWGSQDWSLKYIFFCLILLFDVKYYELQITTLKSINSHNPRKKKPALVKCSQLTLALKARTCDEGSQANTFWGVTSQKCSEPQCRLFCQRWRFPGLKCWLWGKMLGGYLTEDTAGWLIRDNLGFLASTRDFLQLSTVRRGTGLTHIHASARTHFSYSGPSGFLKLWHQLLPRPRQQPCNRPVSPPPRSHLSLHSLSESHTNTAALRKLVSPLSDWLQTQWKDMIQSLWDRSLPFTNLPELLQP